MHKTMEAAQAIAGLQVGTTTSARETGAAKLTALHREIVEAMPTDPRQEIRVLFARLDPGDRTPRHSHRFPVTVYILTGTFTLQLDGREPVSVRAGEVFVEPSQVKMTGRNLDPENPATMVLFYVSTPDTPFADSAD
ncbi:cupin domain-containing protein [Chelativorans sp.]|uniref:cupin domain-containing protein n=1 Tax=Chelativorans sp. TaxID=2203393 RepID=UPI0028117B39|nr:cupin domain-containing protein [Chelativorans sp.]